MSWTAPSSTGGSAITSDIVTPYVGSSAQTPVEVAGSVTSTIVKGLTNGTGYTFTVTAANIAGAGPASEHSGAVVPHDTIFDFATPVAIAASTTNNAGYFTPKGDYSDTSGGFASAGFSNLPLSALANSVSVNGVYAYSATPTFPTSAYKATNYWVDLDFEP